VGGFVSKWFLTEGTIAAGEPMLVSILLLSGLLNAGYLFPIVSRAFFKSSSEFRKFDEASPLLVVPLVITAVLALMLGIYPDGVFRLFWLANETAVSVLGSPAK
jgi:multicomponent Na+:H+ antiporter subunit D